MESLKELYRIGRGPSSSHTMAPCRAAEIFLKENPSAGKFNVTLYGSLAATGKGHFTDTGILSILPAEKTKIFWKPETFLPFHPNGMLFESFDASGRLLRKWTVYSIGGGALREENAEKETEELYPFASMQKIMEECRSKSLALWQLAEICEGPGIWDFLDLILNTMLNAVKNGLEKEGPLPGRLNLPRKARSIFLKCRTQRRDLQRTGRLAAYAYAVSEENASLGIIATAPTCGSCGILPSVLRYMEEELGSSRTELLHALAVAGIVGNLVKQNASISGAEVGCQGEVGTACAMAAAAAAYLSGGSLTQCEYAAEIGLEHFLGLTCDPVLGLVQIPCIERNAIAANRAVIASELALLSDGNHRVSFDAVVQTMLKTGHDLPSLYRETSAGGLSIVVPEENK